jgi:hypothetical protein
VAFGTTGPLLKTKHGNKYVLVVIEHYLKWCKTKAIVDHDVEIVARFLEDEIICKFGVPKYVCIDNGSECYIGFDQLCKNYGIQHLYITLQWFKCNGMVERMVKTSKHGLIAMSTILDHAQD